MTTPVGDDVAIRLNEDIDAYNLVAAEVLGGQKISINDLHTRVRDHNTSLWTDGVHFTDEGAAWLADAVADTIRTGLQGV
jgi:lysophospholipase L1-like esterase